MNPGVEGGSDSEAGAWVDGLARPWCVIAAKHAGCGVSVLPALSFPVSSR